MAQKYCGRKISNEEKKFLLLHGLEQMTSRFGLAWDPDKVRFNIEQCYANAYYNVGGYHLNSELYWDCLKWRYYLNVELKESFFVE